ncbi:putative short chain dehydrogenase/reductase family protein (plasmid) [Simkania negevensis Z]|uniref:Putative short chain dehydrogenase/reductase family protein n=2 Tax=Simkania negevensis TaxID=83561 RepID=F8L322_SIMNZ|nr:putative short chain dehydrogenase/reductase family protein [Simkania negevensis Z]
MKKQIIFITGASKGLGKALAKKFIEEGNTVYCGVRNTSAAPNGSYPVFLDLTIEVSLINAVNHIIKTSGKIDILIHNAGIAFVGPVDSMTLEESRRMFEVNFFAPFRLTQLFLPYFRKQRYGKILFVSSIRAIDSGAYIGLYSASKAALESIAFDWAVTLSRWNIIVSVVQPGPIDTGIELQTGHYFHDNNPYPPLENISLDLQPVDQVCEVIVEKLKAKELPFKFQTNIEGAKTANKHLIDPSWNEWCKAQKSFFKEEESNEIFQSL